MKKQNLILMLAFALISSIMFVSCEKDDEGGSSTNSDELKGEITTAKVLDPTVEYKLIGALIVKEGSSLTIPAGTKIVATDVTTENPDVRYIAVERGAQIYVNGSESLPVVMTSETKETESWGGLVICGAAPQNKAGSAGGVSTSEVADLPYGGSNATDNSGILQYLRIEYTGYKYTDTKEFNGISFFGVGSGTMVDYVVSYMGGDDGFEFFGGTVNASHLVSVGSGDDGIDFADGWSGTGEYWYVYNTAKSGIEGSNNGDDGASNTPMTNATISNMTVYKMGEKPWYLKEGTGMLNVDNLVIGGLADGKGQAYFYADGDDSNTATRITSGNVDINNVAFVNMGTGNTDKTVDGLTVTENPSATGAGNGVNKPVWMPAALNAVSSSINVIPDDVESGLEAALPTGEIDYDLTLNGNYSYKLNGALIMTSGTKLTIPAGTIITATDVTTENPNVRYIAIAQGAQIFVNGEADSPVVMTSETKATESWGGLVLCGNAPQNKAGVDGGESTSEVADLPYGGSIKTDNSGSITYLRIEYTGYKYTDTKEFNGISFFGVGSGTVVDYVVSYMGGDDGFEFFGGTVNASHMVSMGSGDDGIDFADGWSGTGEYWHVKDAAKSAIEGSNNGDDGASNTPMTNATLRNLTLIGMGEKPWYLKEGAGKQTIDNVVIGGLTNAVKAPYFYADSDDTNAAARISGGDVTITNVLLDNIGSVEKAVAGLTVGENASATGAGNGVNKPNWLSDALNQVDNSTKVID